MIDDQEGRFLIRPLQIDDYDRGYLQVLGELTIVGQVSREQFQGFLDHVMKSENLYLVIVDKQDDRIVGAGTLLLEQKIIHSMGKCGHVEDIVVSERVRGRNLGKLLIEALLKHARSMNCYKVILDCAERNVQFYEKCGFTRKEVQMAVYFKDSKC